MPMGCFSWLTRTCVGWSLLLLSACETGDDGQWLEYVGWTPLGGPLDGPLDTVLYRRGGRLGEFKDGRLVRSLEPYASPILRPVHPRPSDGARAFLRYLPGADPVGTTELVWYLQGYMTAGPSLRAIAGSVVTNADGQCLLLVAMGSHNYFGGERPDHWKAFVELSGVLHPQDFSGYFKEPQSFGAGGQSREFVVVGEAQDFEGRVVLWFTAATGEAQIVAELRLPGPLDVIDFVPTGEGDEWLCIWRAEPGAQWHVRRINKQGLGRSWPIDGVREPRQMWLSGSRAYFLGEVLGPDEEVQQVLCGMELGPRPQPATWNPIPQF